MRVREALEPLLRRVQHALRGLQISGFAKQMSESSEDRRGNAVSGRQRIVGHRLGAMDETFVIVGREEEPAVLPVFEMLEHRVRKRDGEFEVAGAPA